VGAIHIGPFKGAATIGPVRTNRYLPSAAFSILGRLIGIGDFFAANRLSAKHRHEG
jgi:hypothetical protein